jgi:hypothetical protein
MVGMGLSENIRTRAFSGSLVMLGRFSRPGALRSAATAEGGSPGRSAASGSTFVYGTMNEAAKNARPSGTIWTTGIATPKAASTKRMIAIKRSSRLAVNLMEYLLASTA